MAAAVLSSTKRCTSDAVCYEEDSSKTCVATHSIWRINGLLVRAHLSNNLLADLQESSVVGISRQTSH